MEVDFKTILIIGAIIFGVWWLSQNKPDTYNMGKDFIVDTGKSIWNSVIKKEPTEPSAKASEAVVDGDVINYGKPYTQFECSSDAQCKLWFGEVDGIVCNIETGECYTAVG